MKYDVDYFIRKFQAIPSRLLIANSFSGDGNARCALGHCGKYYNTEYNALVKVFSPIQSISVLAAPSSGWNVADVNNGKNPNYQQPTPKQRVLAALYDIKKLQDDKTKTEPKERIKTVYVSVPESIVNQSKELILQ